MTDDLYYRKMESTSTTDLVDMIRERDGCIEELEEENAELKKRNGELAGQKASLERWFGEAKAIIKDYIIVATADHCEVCSVPEENRCINVLKLNEQAEQFLEATE